MNLDRHHKIIEDHPHLFRDKTYFDCGDGWLDLIEELANKLEPLIVKCIEDHPDEKDWAPSCAQVKEKYGGLRFYMYSESQEMSKLIDKAEHISFSICENCGEPGKLRGDNWYYTRCDKCWEKIK